MLEEGLYEKLISDSLAKELASTDSAKFDVRTAGIDASKSPEILAKYVAKILEKRFKEISETERDNALEKQVEDVNKVLGAVGISQDESVPKSAEQLLSFFNKQNSVLAVNPKASLVRPETSIAESSLFTGATNEQQMFSELKKEILSCDEIDMLVSFIKWSGLRLMLDELRTFTQNGGKLRVITTSYMGATDARAVTELAKLPNTEVKVSYDTTRTRLHAKAYLFHRKTDYTVAYVGSSNISNAALSSGLEWNLKITKQDLPKTIDKVIASFNAYWAQPEFENYTEADEERLMTALKAEKNFNAPKSYSFEIRPFSYQQEILDCLKTEREVRGHNRNLVIAATGTGKTVISALDYRRFRKENPQSAAKLLFIAHREEILEQSICTFRAVLRDQNFGDLFVGSHTAKNSEHLFVSIQTFNSKDFTERTSPDYFDFIIVDEFHHAAAPSYQKLLNYYKPKILLGLTATPERMDGRNVLDYFDGRIAAEIRLPEAIDRKLLCPFQYFGVTDSIDLSGMKWSRGGYDKTELSNVYSLDTIAAKKRASLVADAVCRYVTDINSVKGLGFCVSIEHAKFMSEQFNAMGIPSMYLTGGSSDEERSGAQARLCGGNVKFIFVVDIYNEGVDIPEVNTVLFLRPTESLTVFLQQLGRGLRLAEGKDCLTVLDFIGQANKKYNFEEKFKALLSNTRHGVIHELKHDFVSVPKGCYIQLEKKAAEYILENVKSAFGNRNALVERIRTFEEDSGLPLTLANFLNYTHLDAIQLYKKATFSRLCVYANVRENFENPNEEQLEKAFGRFAQIDSRNFIAFILDVLQNGLREAYSEKEIRMLQMLHYTIWSKPADECGYANVQESTAQLLKNKELCEELTELLKYNYEHIDFVDAPLNLNFDCPLDLYCTYSRDQVLVACDFMKTSSMREGVKYLPEKKLDLLFVTLNKSESDYSDTTRYNDYSINETTFHWQSQSTTTATSATGERYINGHLRGNQVLLFVRENKKDPQTGMTPPYTCLGKARCISHESSEPMNIVWELENPIPAKYLKKTNRLMVG